MPASAEAVARATAWRERERLEREQIARIGREWAAWWAGLVPPPAPLPEDLAFLREAGDLLESLPQYGEEADALRLEIAQECMVLLAEKKECVTYVPYHRWLLWRCELEDEKIRIRKEQEVLDALGELV